LNIFYNNLKINFNYLFEVKFFLVLFVAFTDVIFLEFLYILYIKQTQSK